MKIIFMGTSSFAARSLEELIKNNYSVEAVFTKVDKPKGRGYKLEFSDVKKSALGYDLKIYQPATLKDPEVIEEIRKINPDLIIVIAYGRILPKEILEIPRLGCINIHGSVLPKYRGAAPVQWSIINGEKYAGVTAMFLDEGVDTGDIILSDKVLIQEQETSQELLDRLADLGAKTLLKTLKMIDSGDLVREKQDEEKASLAPMLTKDLSKITFEKTAREIHNLIRGINPWPVAKVNFGGKILKVYRSRVVSEDDKKGQPGEILDNKNFIVACGSGSIEFLEVQIEGGKKMSGKDFLMGRRASIGDKVLEIN